MSRTIADLTAGTLIYIDEYTNNVATHVPYIYLGLDEGGNARVLRQYAYIQKRMNDTNVASYSGCEVDVWLENTTDGFLSLFDTATKNALTNTSIKYTDYTLNDQQSIQLATISRRCFLLSYTELGWAATAAGSEGKSYLDALKTFYLAQHPGESTVSDNNARITYNQSETAVNAWRFNKWY